ncbi:zinc finger CCCH domain-containing protein 14-like [Orbicella faveolata]|uniref:zinc finger CCCH domain-containing protein 14-like n=1 Tax=Orbicella faveolata TaxID=48498 RepID=UPI0009E54298|nr:zinc finger CCCH domain-containing protein 14-like [Orbicella faveolata]
MEIGNEISQQIRGAIKTKLKELGSYVDEELPDYIMVMLANKRSKEQMTEDLVLFLGANTALFTDWLVNIIQKLQDVTSLQENTEQSSILAKESIPLQTIKTEPVKIRERKERRRSPHRTEAREEQISQGYKSSEKTEKQKSSSNVVKTVGLTSKGSTRKRKHSSSDEEDSQGTNLHSIVKVKDRKPTLPVSKQASGNLIKKAVTEAHLSVNKPVLSSSLKYDPTSPPSPIRSHSYEEKQQQKELLLQQHRELQKQFFQMKEAEVHVEHEEEEVGEDSDKEIEGESTELDGTHVQSDREKGESKEVVEEHKELADAQQPEEPVIELHVSETETLEYGSEPAVSDTRIVAFADSQAGGEDSDEERRKKRKKRRAVKSKKEKPASPKFIVTLDGVDSDMEDKYDVQVKKEKKKKKSKKNAEVDDYEEIDTTDVTEEVKPTIEVAMPEKPAIKQITFDLEAAPDDEDSSQSKSKQAEKCKFWPDCKNGDDCPFYHPTVTCRFFRCTNSVCPYTHKLKNKLQTSPVAAPVSAFMFPSPSVLIPPAPTAQPVPCKFYPSCTKSDCPFYHPQPKPCRFGLNCTRPNCLFTHPAKPSSLKWVSPALHISERRFAMSEQKVTSMPVL